MKTPDQPKRSPDSSPDARGSASKRFQVQATVTAWGYLTIEAPDAATARRNIQRLNPRIDFGFDWDLDTTMFDSGGDVTVEEVNEVEEDEASMQSRVHSGDDASGSQAHQEKS